MAWLEQLVRRLDRDRVIAAETLQTGDRETAWPQAALVRQQAAHLGVTAGGIRLPEYFRGPWERARVCFMGPHVMLLPDEAPPYAGDSLETYVGYYRSRPEKRAPYGHYQAICGDAPWLAVELVQWPCEKGLALQMLKGPDGPSLVADALAMTWALLRDSAVKVLVLTGNDVLRWVLPHLSADSGAPGAGRYRRLPGVTQLHGQSLGTFSLPGMQAHQLTVIASFHWSAELPMFVRKVPGLEGMRVGAAIGAARRQLSAAITAALAGREE